jgi:abortive infection bacteriophage resistance protein
MANKPARTLQQQIELLKSRGLTFRNENVAIEKLSTISYYRLKGYWWDMQSDLQNHKFANNAVFEDIIERYHFDKKLRQILFDAIESIEVTLRSKMIYHLSLKYGGLWYLDDSLFIDKQRHNDHLNELKKEFDRSHEIFAQDHRNRYPNADADAWKIFEVASFGTLSKFYKNLQHQLPEKLIIANEFGLNRQSELSSWLEAISYVRNIVAHHSRLWNRNMVRTPIFALNNPTGVWFQRPLNNVQTKKPFLIISCMVYLCDRIGSHHSIKSKILDLFKSYPNVPIYKMGFLNNWQSEQIWR